MEYSINWDRVRFDVDIEQYFLFKMGNLYQFDRYKKAYVQKNNDGYGDIIRFFNHEKSGVKMYYSLVNQDSGDIIQFIKKRILKNTSAKAEEINQEIRNFTGKRQNIARTVVNTQFLQSHSETKPEENYRIHGDIIQNIEQHKSYLQDFRKLSAEVLNSALFQSIFYTYSTGKTESLSYDISNIEGDRVGVVRIQTTNNQYFNKKWFDKNSRNGIGFTFSRFLPNTETLSIFESIFDAISFHELFSPESIQYCSTNGELSFRKAQLIRDYFQKNKFRKLILGNDNDLAGNYFNLNIVSAFTAGVIAVRKSEKNICIETQTDTEDKQIKVLSNFFKKADNKFELDDQSEFPQSYYTETLSKNKTAYYFMIANATESIQFFVGLLMRVWNLNEMITIQSPKNKDFNEDLIQLKSTKDGKKGE